MNYPIYFDDTIIIVAIYLGDYEKKKYDITIECLKSIREYYKTNKIIAVDNNSVNTSWYNIAVTLNIHLLKNTSSYYKYEPGAYLYALKYFRAKNYIFIQGNIIFHKNIKLLLDDNKPDAVVFNTFNNICLNNPEIILLNECLNKLNIPNWNDDYDLVTTWNCFYCNNLFVEELLKDKIFKFKCNNKILSCLYERIISVYIRHKIGILKTLSIDYKQNDDELLYTKHHFFQV